MNNLSWYAPEYIHTHKTADWYWVVGIVAVSIALIAVILNNIIFGILVIISATILALYATREPETVFVELDTNGIHIGNIYHPYSDMESFWVDHNTTHPKILFKSKKKLSLFIYVLIDTVDPLDVEVALEQHIHKTQHTEPLLEKLLIYLGF